MLYNREKAGKQNERKPISHLSYIGSWFYPIISYYEEEAAWWDEADTGEPEVEAEMTACNGVIVKLTKECEQSTLGCQGVMGKQGVIESDPYTLVVKGFLDGGHGRYHDEIRPSHETTFTTSV